MKFMRNASHSWPNCIPNTVHGIIHEPQDGDNGLRASVLSEHVHLQLFLVIQESSQRLGVSNVMLYTHEQTGISGPE